MKTISPFVCYSDILGCVFCQNRSSLDILALKWPWSQFHLDKENVIVYTKDRWNRLFWSFFCDCLSSMLQALMLGPTFDQRSKSYPLIGSRLIMYQGDIPHWSDSTTSFFYPLCIHCPPTFEKLSTSSFDLFIPGNLTRPIWTLADFPKRDRVPSSVWSGSWSEAVSLIHAWSFPMGYLVTTWLLPL